jgi:thermitase
LIPCLCMRGQSVKHLKQIKTHVIKVPPQALEAVMRALSNNPNIDYPEKDMLVAPDAITPDDPSYSSQWHLPKIQAPDAWESSTGSGITVAILDTGVESSHPDLVNNLVPGWNVVSNNSDTSPVMSHGTRVAGVVAASSNNSTGVASIAWNAKIMPISKVRLMIGGVVFLNSDVLCHQSYVNFVNWDTLCW